MRLRFGIAFAAIALCLGAAATAFGAEDLEKLRQKLIKEQCNLCHSSKRILTMDPAAIAAVVERMRKMNPDWFADIKSEHMVEAIAALIKDPALAAARAAWSEAVDRGAKLYADASLGKSGKSCKSCHDTKSLRNVADAFPRWDPTLKRFVDINEAINRMVAEKLGGTPFAPVDQKLFDLLAYLKSLK